MLGELSLLASEFNDEGSSERGGRDGMIDALRYSFPSGFSSASTWSLVRKKKARIGLHHTRTPNSDNIWEQSPPSNVPICIFLLAMLGTTVRPDSVTPASRFAVSSVVSNAQQFLTKGYSPEGGKTSLTDDSNCSLSDFNDSDWEHAAMPITARGKWDGRSREREE